MASNFIVEVRMFLKPKLLSQWVRQALTSIEMAIHPFSYKLIVYLTDVDESSGALAIKPGSFKKVILPTFGSYNYERNLEHSNYKKFGLLGMAGTKVLFKNNALHAGGRTTKGERIVVAFLLHPRFLSCQDSAAQNIDWTIGGREYSLL